MTRRPVSSPRWWHRRRVARQQHITVREECDYLRARLAGVLRWARR